MKILYFILAMCFFNEIPYAQEFKKSKLTKRDMGEGIIAKYKYASDDGYNSRKLVLYKNRNYYYTKSGHGENGFNRGKWYQKGKIIELRSEIDKNNLPIKLLFSADTSQMINGFKIGIVKNLKGEEMPDGLVAINNDSLLCSPSDAICDSDFKSIDSLKIIFENGFSSKWIRVNNYNYKRIVPIIQTNFLISAYIALDNKRYRISGSSFIPFGK